MFKRTKDPIRELLRRSLNDAAREAEAGGIISSERVEALDRISKVIEMRQSVRAQSLRWALPLIFTGTLALVSILLFAHIAETDIQMDLSLANVSFELPQDTVFSGAMELSALGVSDIREIESSVLTDFRQTPPQSVVFRSLTERDRRGTITLAPLVVGRGSRVSLHASGEANQYRFSAGANGMDFRVVIDGPIMIGPSGAPARKLDLATPATVDMLSGSDFVLDLTFVKMPQTPISPALEIRNFSFQRIEEFLQSDRSFVTGLSGILSGTLYLESLNGLESRLRPREELRFENSQGSLSALDLADGTIEMKFRGRVRGMTTGNGTTARTLMPTVLEWLRARHGISLLWGTSLYVFGLIVAAMGAFGRLKV